MLIKNTLHRYGVISKTLHWTISPLVILMLIGGYFMDDISNLALKGLVYNVHKLTGIFILCLMLIRLVWALSNPKPRPPEGTLFIEHVAEWVGHFLLYALIIIQPIVGWVGSVSAGHSPHIGSWMLNLTIPSSEWLTKLCFQIHDTLAVVIIAVLSLHVSAALYHHCIRKDDVLTRMLP